MNEKHVYRNTYFELLTTLSFYLGALCADYSLEIKNTIIAAHRNETRNNNDFKAIKTVSQIIIIHPLKDVIKRYVPIVGRSYTKVAI
ncbi:unnamed protein product, partial [Didymodactylos carnosus]